MQRSTWSAWRARACFSFGLFVASASGWASDSTAATASPGQPGQPGQAGVDETPPPVPGTESLGAPTAYVQSLEGKFNKLFYGEFSQLAPYEVVGAPDATRTVEVRFAVRWDGTIAALTVAHSSGVPAFDDGAIEVIKKLAPYRPPVDVLADDGLAHFLWRFGRRMEEAGGKVEQVEFPLNEAVPRLVAAGRVAEAERRVKEALESPTAEAGVLAVFARAVLAQPTSTPEESLVVAQEHAALLDGRAAFELRRWLFLPETAPDAARSLIAAGVDIAPDVKRALDEGGNIQQAGLAIALAVPEALRSCDSCLAALADASRSGRGRTVESRKAAIKSLGVFRTGPLARSAQEALGRLGTDADPMIRASALLAGTAPQDGRKALFKMSPLLKDPSPAIRGAAAAAVLRIGGDHEIDELYGVYREHSDVAFGFLAEELGRQKGPATLDMLGKLLHKAEGKRRVMLIEALAARTDAPARAMLDPILVEARRSPEEEISIRRLALRGASVTDILTMASDTRLGLDGYRALLANGLAREAAAWLLDRFDALDRVSRLRALGLWLEPRDKDRDALATSAGLMR